MRNQIGDYTIVWQETISSTNEYATKYQQKTKNSDKIVIGAYSQYSGRGQRDNKWESEDYKNLTISILFKPSFVEAISQFRISEIVSLGVFDYLSTHIKDVAIKWPNDIYIKDKKIAGILIEHLIMGASIASSICGIGLNINQEIFKSDAPNPVSLKQLTGKDYNIDIELEALLSCIDKRYKMLEKGNDALLRKDYHAALYRRNEYHMFKKEDKTFEAKIMGVNEIGQLVLEDKTGESTFYNFKEVAFL